MNGQQSTTLLATNAKLPLVVEESLATISSSRVNLEVGGDGQGEINNFHPESPVSVIKWLR